MKEIILFHDTLKIHVHCIQRSDLNRYFVTQTGMYLIVTRCLHRFTCFVVIVEKSKLTFLGIKIRAYKWGQPSVAE